MGSAHAGCKTLNGHVSSEVVAVLPDGTACPSPIGLCTAGKYIGGLKGRFIFVATGIVDNPDSTEVEFTTGFLNLETKKGTLYIDDTSSVSFGADGLFGGVQTIVGGTGKFDGATGRIRVFGVFLGGCVSCDYRGEICKP